MCQTYRYATSLHFFPLGISFFMLSNKSSLCMRSNPPSTKKLAG
jgi:hypothetical protein